MIVPKTLITITTERSKADGHVWSTMPQRLVLALLLNQYSVGIFASSAYEAPTWAPSQNNPPPLPQADLMNPIDRPLSSSEFDKVMALAIAIPEFTVQEHTRVEIILRRSLRGLGATSPEAGFIDLVTALEALLLPGINMEVSYRFRLYGALFLREERDPQEVFTNLRDIYDVRSKMVHGEPVTSERRIRASQYANDLARAMVLRGILHGWPDPKQLDRDALTLGSFSDQDSEPV